jgi:hypothetical protein
MTAAKQASGAAPGADAPADAATLVAVADQVWEVLERSGIDDQDVARVAARVLAVAIAVTSNDLVEARSRVDETATYLHTDLIANWHAVEKSRRVQ